MRARWKTSTGSNAKGEAVDPIDPAGAEAETGGAEEEPPEDTDTYRQLAAERSAIIREFANRLRSAPRSARRAVKEARQTALAAAARRAKAEVAGRRRRRMERKATRLRGPAHK